MLRSFPVRWEFMGEGSLGNIGAWVTKKVPELVGMEEPDLVEFIMGHVRQHALAGEQLLKTVDGSSHLSRACEQSRERSPVKFWQSCLASCTGQVTWEAKLAADCGQVNLGCLSWRSLTLWSFIVGYVRQHYATRTCRCVLWGGRGWGVGMSTL